MSNICTSVEQSKKLIELGLDINTADMCYKCEDFVDEETGEIINATKLEIGVYNNSTPAWSLSALLNLMPNGSVLTKTNFGNYTFQGVVDKTPIDAAFNYICYLFEKGILKQIINDR